MFCVFRFSLRTLREMRVAWPPGWSETPFPTSDRTTFWLCCCVAHFHKTHQSFKKTDRAEEFGLSFAKLLNAVVRNVHTTAGPASAHDALSIPGKGREKVSHISALLTLSCETCQYSGLVRFSCFTMVFSNRDANAAKDVLTPLALLDYVRQERNRSFGGLTCLSS